MTIRFSGITGLAIYFGIGALLHAVCYSAHFDFASAWTWGILLAWPFMIAGFVIGAGLLVLAILAAWVVFDDWRIARRRKGREIAT